VLSLVEFVGHTLFATVIFLLLLGIPALAYRYWRGRGRRLRISPSVGAEGEAMRYDLPLVGSRVGCQVVDPDTGKEVQVTGILMAYGTFNEGRGIFKYLTSVRTVEGGKELGEIVDLKGQGVRDWITCQRISSREEMYQKLGLTSPKQIAISSVGKWRERGKLAWRRPSW